VSLLDSLKAKAISSVNDEERQAEWVDKGFDAAMKEGREILPTGDTPEETAARETAEFALSKLENNKASLVGLGAHGLRSTITLLGLGKLDDAARHAATVKLRTTATWSEVSATIIATSEEGNQVKRELDAEIAATKALLKEIGITAGKALLPVLLAVI
jgi:hypothetical protein